jgi:[protein-PII] uridylyltransferase
LFESQLMVNSAHITNYGERAADTFYVTDLIGQKVVSADRLKGIEERLLAAASEGEPVREAEVVTKAVTPA